MNNRIAVLFTPATGFTLAALFAVLAFALSALGRIPVCTCGFGIWTSSAWSNETSQMFMDPYSFSHILHGFIFYGALKLALPKLPVRYRLLIAICIEIAWEIAENSPIIINRYRAETASLDYTGDSILNSIGDVISTALGFAFAARFHWKITLVVLIIIELALLIAIRDNLTLNILMLIHPVAAIRTWQMAH